MTEYHSRTIHTYESVRMPRFLDWDTQPRAVKEYPGFYNRVPFSSLPLSDFWPLIGGITSERNAGDHRYSLRTIPSAGGLYPVELYIQVRDLDGIMDGIYHYEATTSSLVLLHPIDRDGVEPYLGRKRTSGIVFLVSSPYFRSFWKYGKRSFRYCVLDAGHLLGAIEAACEYSNREMIVQTSFQKEDLNQVFGFEDKEFFLSAAISGREEEGEIRPLKLQLPHVLPTDYHESAPSLLEAYRDTLGGTESKKSVIINNALYDISRLSETIRDRRSIRAFSKKEMEAVQADAINTILVAETPFEIDPEINVYAIVSPRVSGYSSGIYKNGILLREGNFTEKAGYLCLEQKLGSDSGITIFLTGRSNDYQSLMQKAGLMGHRVYLKASEQGIGVSGIGAFYDKEVAEFLQTNEMILYALAVGY